MAKQKFVLLFAAVSVLFSLLEFRGGLQWRDRSWGEFYLLLSVCFVLAILLVLDVLTKKEPISVVMVETQTESDYFEEDDDEWAIEEEEEDEEEEEISSEDDELFADLKWLHAQQFGERMRRAT